MSPPPQRFVCMKVAGRRRRGPTAPGGSIRAAGYNAGLSRKQPPRAISQVDFPLKSSSQESGLVDARAYP
jgi:hypothetical protein